MRGGPQLLSGCSEPQPTALSSARYVGRIDEPIATLLRDLYGLGDLNCVVGEECWRFRWRHFSGAFSGVLFGVRLGPAKAIVGIEDLTQFGVSPAIMRAEVPDALRVAYLSGAGAELWRQIEGLAGFTVELLEVRCASKTVAAHGLGFELRRNANDSRVRGYIAIGANAGENASDELWRILRHMSVTKMRRRAPRRDVLIQWAAVAGYTKLSSAQLRALHTGDTVLIDNTAYSEQALECQLCAGINRHRVGWLRLKQGTLRLGKFTTRQEVAMSTTSDEASPAQTPVDGFGEIEVALRFELARWRASLAEVAALAEGSVIDIGQRLDEPTIALWAEQRCIGAGQLVAIGDRLGVRVMSVSTEEDGVAMTAATGTAATGDTGQSP